MDHSTRRSTWLGLLAVTALCSCASTGSERKVDETIRGGQTVTASEFQEEEQNYQGDLAPLGREDADETLRSMRPRLQACAAKYRKSGNTTFVISLAAGGKVRAVRPEGGFAGTEQAACMVKVIQATPFPPCAPTTFPFPYAIDAH